MYLHVFLILGEDYYYGVHIGNDCLFSYRTKTLARVYGTHAEFVSNQPGRKPHCLFLMNKNRLFRSTAEKSHLRRLHKCSASIYWQHSSLSFVRQKQRSAKAAPGGMKCPTSASAPTLTGFSLQNSLIIHQFLTALTAERKMM